MADEGSEIKGITANNITVKGNSGRIGGIVGLCKDSIIGCTINDSNISENSEMNRFTTSTGGIAGILTNTSTGTTTKMENCNVNRTKITAVNGDIGGAVGFSNNTITGVIVTDSEVKSTGNTATDATACGAGGILGHGSNRSGSDVTITNSKVIDTKVTGNNMVGGIVGAAVTKVQNCYVGGKENETFAEGEYAVEVKGKERVGSIIGDAGVITDNAILMLQMLSNTVKNTKVERQERELEPGETPDIYGMIGLHTRAGETYTGTITETITGNTASNCEIVNIVNP